MKDELCIIGMAGKYPNSDNLDVLWEQLCLGKNFIIDCPENRRKFIEGSSINETLFPKAAYLSDIFAFDNEFFNISPKDAEVMDPYQKLFLEVSYQALENAGLLGVNQSRSIGVFVGISTEYSKRAFQNVLHDAKSERYKDSFIGNLPAAIPARISYYLDLQGPAMLLDTSCSSSITAFDVACKSVLSRECRAGIVGGINIFTDPSENSVVKELGIFSEESKISAFDDNRGGVVNGEGCGVVVVKRLEDALKDNDNIYCVIKSSFCNQDGKSFGITAPNMNAQEDCIKKAWKSAQINPLNIRYIEAHGTGTELGDPTEVGAISKAFQSYSVPKQFCGIGSVKTNLGHTIGAAGITGIIKCSLILKNKVIPPSLNFSYPNRNIAFEDSPLYVVTDLERVDDRIEKNLCCVNSFGITGSNGHVVLEEFKENLNMVSDSNPSKKYLVLFSDLNSQRLKQKIAGFKKRKRLSDSEILTLSFSSLFRSRIFSERIVFLVRNADELYAQINEYLNSAKSTETVWNLPLLIHKADEYYQLAIDLAKVDNISNYESSILKFYPEFQNIRYFPYVNEVFIKNDSTIHLDRNNELTSVQTNSFIPVIKKERLVIDIDNNLKELKVLYITKEGFLASSENLSYEDLKKKKRRELELLQSLEEGYEQVICINDDEANQNEVFSYTFIECLVKYLTDKLEAKSIKKLSFIGLSTTTGYLSAINDCFFGICKNLIFEYPSTLIKCFEVSEKFVLKQVFKIVNSKTINKIKQNYLMYESLNPIQLNKSAKNQFFKGKKVGLVGGTGRIGTQLIPLLLEDQVEKIYVFHRNYKIQKEDSDKVIFKIIDIVHLVPNEDNIELFKNLDVIVNLTVDDSRFSMQEFDLNLFKRSLDVKVKGVQNLLEICRRANIKQILNFSSVIDYTGGTNNLSYIMANSFVDGISDMFRNDDIIVQSINWPEWANIGISEDISFRDSESLFKKVDVEDGYTFMKNVLEQGVSKIIFGEINCGSQLLGILNMLPVTVELDFKSSSKQDVEVIVDKEDFNEEEIVKIIADVMGYETVDLQKSFIELGGDSITALKICTIFLSNNIEVEPNVLIRSRNIGDFIDAIMMILKNDINIINA